MQLVVSSCVRFIKVRGCLLKVLMSGGKWGKGKRGFSEKKCEVWVEKGKEGKRKSAGRRGKEEKREKGKKEKCAGGALDAKSVSFN